MMPYEESRLFIDPLLPEIIESNHSGAKQWLWGKKPIANTKMNGLQVCQDAHNETVTVRMESQYYMSERCHIVKKMTLEENSTVLSVSLKVKSSDKKDVEFMLWENIIPKIGKYSTDFLIIPARGKVKDLNGRSVKLLPEDDIFIESSRSNLKDSYFAPARPWIARSSKERDIVFAVRTKLEDLNPEGFFYRWKDASGSRMTQEMVFSKVKLSGPEEKEYFLDYMVFPGMTGLKDICGNIGIDCEIINNKELSFSFCSVKQEKTSKLILSLNFVNGGGTSVPLGDIQLPELVAGKAVKVVKSLPSSGIPDGKYRIIGKFENGQSFELLSPKINVP